MPQLPNNFTTQISSSTTEMIATLAPVAVLIIGVLLAAVVLTVIIKAIRG
jgi:hypothetical protein